MLLAPLLSNEELRLKDLLFYNILDTPREKNFNDLAELAAYICGCPYAMISFIDDKRQWVKAAVKIPLMEVNRDATFCAHTILKNEVMVVKNARLDKRFSDNPNVKEGLKIAFYAGAPVISATGFAIGTVCVIGNEINHSFTDMQKDALKIIAGQVSALVDLRLKNKLITEHSNRMLATEKKLARLNLINHEKEKTKIATELQENFAQTLAGVKLYLEFAEQAKEIDISIMQKSKDHIIDMIKDVKALTKSIVPTTFENDNYMEILNDMSMNFGKVNNIFIKITYSKGFKGFNSEAGLAIFKIIENKLKIAKSIEAKNIWVRISQGNKIKILFTDDGNKNIAFKEQENLLLNNILTRAEILNGKLTTPKNVNGKNIFKMEIPLRDKPVKEHNTGKKIYAAN